MYIIIIYKNNNVITHIIKTNKYIIKLILIFFKVKQILVKIII